MSNPFWTPKLLKQAVEAAKASENGREAHAKFLKASKEAVTYPAFQNALKGSGTPMSTLFRRAAHPVEVAVAKEEASKDKGHIKQLVKELREANARQALLDVANEAKGTPKILPREKKSGKREMTAVALASDWHVEETVNPESVGFVNEYNLDIADVRVKRFFNGIIWQVEHHRADEKIAINDLIFWLGGDLFSGFLHPDLVQSNALSPTEAVRWLIPRLRDGIHSLLEKLDLAHIEIPCSYGNHGRFTDKTRINCTSSNSFDFLLYHSLADEFRKEKRIHFSITSSSHQYVEVYDKVLHFTHGDSLKYAGGIGGLAVPLLKAVGPWDAVRRADLHAIGHFHQLADYGKAVVNGSLIGFAPFSQWIRASVEPPQQLFFMWDSKRGKCMTTPLWVGEGDVVRR